MTRDAKYVVLIDSVVTLKASNLKYLCTRINTCLESSSATSSFVRASCGSFILSWDEELRFCASFVRASCGSFILSWNVKFQSCASSSFVVIPCHGQCTTWCFRRLRHQKSSTCLYSHTISTSNASSFVVCSLHYCASVYVFRFKPRSSATTDGFVCKCSCSIHSPESQD